MSSITPGRSTMLTSSERLLSNLRDTQQQIAKLQGAIETGKEVNKPSDAPERTSGILLLHQKLEARDQHDRNLTHAIGILNATDDALADASDIVIEAQSIGISELSLGSDDQTRAAQATIIDEQLSALIAIANRTVQNLPLFGGVNTREQPFESFLGGVRYVGSTGEQLAVDAGLVDTLPFNSSGTTAFGALSARVKSVADLDPQASSDTKLRDLRGAQAQGVRLDTLVVTVNGSATNVDLTGSDTLGDVVTRVNEALGAAGSLAVSGSGLSLTAAGGNSVTLSSLGAGEVAEDLGIALTATGGSVQGGDLDAKLTKLTALSDLSATVDFSSGLLITQGSTSKVADFSGASTVEDLINVVDALELGVRVEINAEGNALDFVSEVSGIELSIGENGGSTAEDLGVRTYGLNTKLNDFRFGLGVDRVEGSDFGVSLHDGRSFEVDISSVTTIQETIDAINAAASAAGISSGEFSASLATTGNGLTLSDNTAGPGDFKVTRVVASSGKTALAAEHLGIESNVGSGGTITGEDLSKVRVESVFTHLSILRDALRTGDATGITVATDGLKADVDQTARERATIGVMARRVEDEQSRSAELGIAERTMLSQLQDTDMTQALTRYTQLLQQLEASLQVGTRALQLSLLDYLG